MKKVVLKPGKEKAIGNRHHWIFSGAILSKPEVLEGDIFPVYSAKGNLLGSAYFNRRCSLMGRMLCFNDKNPKEEIRHQIKEAIELRKRLFNFSMTNAYRLINGEGDCLPGLIVDQYNDILVIQISTLGMEKLKEWIVEFLVELLHPKMIYEKSLMPSRKEEGLKDREGVLYGKQIEAIQIVENGYKFYVDFLASQKTGFFLDHREMRKYIQSFSQNKRVLNCFSYSGGFSVYALAGGAKKVVSIDISPKAIELAKKNVDLNGFNAKLHEGIVEDAFKFLHESDMDYDLVILDPPAFAKKQKDIIQACRGYKEINRTAMAKMPRNSFLLTSSCSYHVDRELFQKVIFQAALEAKREVKVLSQHYMAPDHPINIFHPEGDYLKSLFLYIS